MIEIAGHEIQHVSLTDDDESVRGGYALVVEDVDLTPVEECSPEKDIDRFVETIIGHSQAGICDFQLRKRNYARFNGHEVVARLYSRGFPTLLCTAWDDAKTGEIRPYRERIPVLLRQGELNPDSMMRGWEVCLREFTGKFLPTRRAWRALVSVEEVEGVRGENRIVYVTLPSWHYPRQIVSLRLKDIPEPIRPAVVAGALLHAKVNVGAEETSELYFTAWEPR